MVPIGIVGSTVHDRVDGPVTILLSKSHWENLRQFESAKRNCIPDTADRTSTRLYMRFHLL